MLGLSETERKEVEAAIAAAARRTSARFAVVVAHASDDYAAYPMLTAAMIALIVGDVVALAWPALGTWWVVAVQAALFVVADLVLHRRPLRYRLVPPRVKRAHAQKLARLEFAALVHDRTPGDVGLLLFVSEAERHVEIVADSGIDQHVDQAAWDRIVTDFVARGRAGAVAAGLSGAIAGCATILERHFPPRAGAAAASPGKVTEL
jgi:putative membrane protein